MYWDLQKFYDSIDVRRLLRLGAECGFSERVAVVDLQVHLGLRAPRGACAFAKPQIVANSILAGSKFSNAYARNMLYGVLEVHRSVPLDRVDQHVDELTQCAVGHQTAVIKQMVEVAGIITFACDRLSLVISPKSTVCCSDVKTETPLRRGLLELGIHCKGDPRLGSRHGRRRKTCCRRDDETPVQGPETKQETRCHSSSY